MQFDDSVFSVLLIEDELDENALLKKSLEQDSQTPAHVDSAKNVQEALEKMKTNSYHVLLVESQIQNIDQLKLLDEMKNSGIYIPFILMTPIRDDRLVRDAMRLGVAEVIVTNENHYESLAAHLREFCQKYHEQREKQTPEQSSDASSPAGSSEGQEALDNEAPPIQVSHPQYAEPAIKDELTGVFNHGYIHERIVREFSRASRYSYPLSCLMIDIDHFKIINEQKGYRVGDLLLKEFAQLLFESCRLSDLIGRYGGTEFIVLLPHISYQGAEDMAKRLRMAVAEHVFLAGADNLNITISVGLSAYPEDFMNRRSDLITFARRALLHAKASGRNRCILYREMEPISLQSKIPKLEISEEKISEFQRRISEVAENARRECLKFSQDLISALESKDAYTAGHGTNCAKYAKHIADAMGLSTQEAEVVENAALLHDIGKICIPDVILLKTGKLTFSEYEIMKQHAYFGYKILNPIKFLREEALIILHHHEWFNGEGYPCHLRGEEIPLGSRIIGVIDAYDTMRVSGGRYRRTTTVEHAVNELVNFSGVQFDPLVVKYFIDVIKMRKELLKDCFDKNILEQRIKTAKRKNSPEETPHPPE